MSDEEPIQIPNGQDFLDDAINPLGEEGEPDPSTIPPEGVDEPMQVIVYITPFGFQFSIPPELNPVTLAGIAWYLDQMSEIGLANQMMAQAEAAEKERRKQAGILVPNRAMRRAGVIQ